jgi:hypothetical protein
MSENSFKKASDTHTPVSSLLSKRGMLRLAELQSLLGKEIRALSEQHTRLVGALLACERTVQYTMLGEYREQLHLIHTTVAKIRILLERVNDNEFQQLGE